MAPKRTNAPNVTTRLLAWARGKEFEAEQASAMFGKSVYKRIFDLCAGGKMRRVRDGVYVEIRNPGAQP